MHHRRLASLLAAGVLSACGTSTPAPPSVTAPAATVTTAVADPDTAPLRFHGCSPQCRGTLSGAAYQVLMPQTWNGTLLLWSHGYRAATPSPPDFSQPYGDAEAAPDLATTQALLRQGYALAGSGYARNGWAVPDGVTAGEQLHAWFVAHVGAPRRTYVWGASLGGLVTELLSERHPDWVSGAAPECGAVVGTTAALDRGLAVALMVKTLLAPRLVIGHYTSAGEADASFTEASRAVTAAAGTPSGAATVTAIAVLAGEPARTQFSDGHDAASRLAARVEGVLDLVSDGTFVQQELDTRTGGPGLDLSGVRFASAVDDSGRAEVKALGGDLDRLAAQLDRAPRPTAGPAGRQAVRDLGEPTGRVSHPTVTLHDEDDPDVQVQGEAVLAGTFAAAGSSDRLLQLFTKAPATYSTAPYGAGHCRFTTSEQTALVATLDRWVRTGVRRPPAGLPELDPTFVPPPPTLDLGAR